MENNIVNPPKWWLDSSTIRGTLLTIGPILIVLLNLFGVKVSDTEIGVFIDAVVSVIGAYGVFMAIKGRFDASRTISIERPET